MASKQEDISTGDIDSDVIWSEDPEHAYFQSMINGRMDRGDFDSLTAEILDCQTTGEEIEESGLSWGTAPNSDTVSMSRRRQAPVDQTSAAFEAQKEMMRNKLGWASESSDGDTANSRISESFSFYARKLDMEMASSGKTIDSYGRTTDSYGYPKEQEKKEVISPGHQSNSLDSPIQPDADGDISSMSRSESFRHSRPPLISRNPNERMMESSVGKPPLPPSRPPLPASNDQNERIKDREDLEFSGENAKTPRKQNISHRGDKTSHVSQRPPPQDYMDFPPSPSRLVVRVPSTLSENDDRLPLVRADSFEKMSAMSNVSSLDSLGFSKNWWNTKSLASTLSNPSAKKAPDDDAQQDNAIAASDRPTRRVPGLIFLGDRSSNARAAGDKSSNPDQHESRIYYLKIAVIVLFLAIAASVVLLTHFLKKSQEKSNVTSPFERNPTLAPGYTFPPAWFPDPTLEPTESPTASPTLSPTRPGETRAPTPEPSSQPTPLPSFSPTKRPTLRPSASPTLRPTTTPSLKPSPFPSSKPSQQPSSNPTATLSQNPTFDQIQLVFDQVLARILGYSPDSVTSIQDTGSPQYRALDWIARNDVNALDYSDFLLLQRWVLITLYHSMGGENWSVSNSWVSVIHECEWFGVTCNGASRKIIALNLSNNNAIGALPKEIYLLSDLASLRFEGNIVTSTIPTEVAQLTNLKVLKLNSNALAGSIPTQFGNIAVLGEFQLYKMTFVVVIK